jgi:O-6-methylguanine DNA methyltransferase
MKGTPFQLKVWNGLREIPYGDVRSYGQIAKAIGHPGAARAVGTANRMNPVGIFVPCHRVIASAGKIGGFACGLEFKRVLLGLEGLEKFAEAVPS